MYGGGHIHQPHLMSINIRGGLIFKGGLYSGGIIIRGLIIRGQAYNQRFAVARQFSPIIPV